jgi:hypothetical protein
MTLLRLAAAHICAVLPYSSLRLEVVKPNFWLEDSLRTDFVS